MTEALARIEARLGPGAVLTGAADMAGYCRDWSGRLGGPALAVVRPGTTADTAFVVSECAAAGIAVVPQGGNTGVCGGAVPSGGMPVVLSTERLTRIRQLDPAANVMVAEAGCVLADLQTAARDANRLMALSLGAEGSCRIGGNVSTNAGGLQALRYGSARDMVLGVEVVLADGQVWDGLRTLRKDNAGYHLKDLFIGAEGTLGVVTAVSLRLHPLPRAEALAWVAVPDVPAALALLNLTEDAFPGEVTAFELMSAPLWRMTARHHGLRLPLDTDAPWLVLLHLAGAGPEAALQDRLAAHLAEGHAESLVLDAALAESLAQRQAFWALRHGVTAANRARGFNVTHDIAVPVARAAAFFDRADALFRARLPQAEVYSVSHLGDGNLHYTVTIPEDRRAGIDEPALAEFVTGLVHDLAHDLGGTFTAEHGVGTRYRAALDRYRPAVELDLMRRIKAALDPARLMNPGKVLAPPAPPDNGYGRTG